MHFGPAKNALFQSKMPKKFTKNVIEKYLGHLGLQIDAIFSCNFNFDKFLCNKENVQILYIEIL